MEAECSICSDQIWADPSAQISVTKCGHMFHQICLTRWFSEERRQNTNRFISTCPQCRSQVPSTDVFRIYANTPGRAVGGDNDAALLQTSFNSAQTLLNQQKELFKRREDKIKQLEAAAKEKEDIMNTTLQKITELTAERERLTQKSKATEEDLNKRIVALNGQVNETTKQLVNKENTIVQLNDKTKALKAQIEQLSQENHKLKNDNDKLKENVQKLEGNLSTANKKLARRDAILAARQVVKLTSVNIIGGEDNKMDEIMNDLKMMRKELALLHGLKKEDHTLSTVVPKTEQSEEYFGVPLPTSDSDSEESSEDPGHFISDDGLDNRRPMRDDLSKKESSNEPQNNNDDTLAFGISKIMIEDETITTKVTENEEVPKSEEVTVNANAAEIAQFAQNAEVAKNVAKDEEGAVGKAGVKNENVAKDVVKNEEVSKSEELAKLYGVSNIKERHVLPDLFPFVSHLGSFYKELHSVPSFQDPCKGAWRPLPHPWAGRSSPPWNKL